MTETTGSAARRSAISALKLILAVFILFAVTGDRARAATFAEIFAKSDENATQTVDHSAWDRILETYLQEGPDDLAVFDYGAVSDADRKALKDYIASLAATQVTALSKAEQFALWINLYNALTIDVILENYPVDSIRDIKSGLFSTGPWGLELVTVEGYMLTLDDIEHGILRPIWQTKLIHYGVNCASVGCPNLATRAYTGDNAMQLLEQGARDYINSPRGARFDGDELIASKLFSWYDDDFGDEAELLAHLRENAGPELKAKLEGRAHIDDYEYDWTLNAPQ